VRVKKCVRATQPLITSSVCILMACGYIGWVVLYFNGLWLCRVGGGVLLMACGYVGWVVLYL